MTGTRGLSRCFNRLLTCFLASLRSHCHVLLSTGCSDQRKRKSPPDTWSALGSSLKSVPVEPRHRHLRSQLGFLQAKASYPSLRPSVLLIWQLLMICVGMTRGRAKRHYKNGMAKVVFLED
ncbi:hypothetical protein KC351_g87 [Hortaea werneckii]|nr:hypothetical protein KC351_g87 [Hortaea werneckii]